MKKYLIVVLFTFSISSLPLVSEASYLSDALLQIQVPGTTREQKITILQNVLTKLQADLEAALEREKENLVEVKYGLVNPNSLDTSDSRTSCVQVPYSVGGRTLENVTISNEQGRFNSYGVYTDLATGNVYTIDPVEDVLLEYEDTTKSDGEENLDIHIYRFDDSSHLNQNFEGIFDVEFDRFSLTDGNITTKDEERFVIREENTLIVLSGVGVNNFKDAAVKIMDDCVDRNSIITDTPRDSVKIKLSDYTYSDESLLSDKVEEVEFFLKKEDFGSSPSVTLNDQFFFDSPFDEKAVLFNFTPINMYVVSRNNKRVLEDLYEDSDLLFATSDSNFRERSYDIESLVEVSSFVTNNGYDVTEILIEIIDDDSKEDEIRVFVVEHDDLQIMFVEMVGVTVLARGIAESV